MAGAVGCGWVGLPWTEAAGKTWLGYTDPEWIAHRRGLAEPSAQAVRAMRAALAKLAGAAAGYGPVTS